ncbi:diguanylate cyclase [Shewanella sp. A14]
MLLLSFLLVVIVYSIYKLDRIDSEMKEVAYVDVPLSQIMSEIEILQLEQHILLEQFKLKQQKNDKKRPVYQQFVYQKQQLKRLLDNAVNVITANLSKHNIRFDLTEHQRLLSEIEDYHQQSNLFEEALMALLSVQQTDDTQKAKLELMATDLEAYVDSILRQLSQVTLAASRYTEKHEQEFRAVNIALGFSALILGLLLTISITRIIRHRINRIKNELQVLDDTLLAEDSALVSTITKSRTKDELAELELDLKLLMQRLSKEITDRKQIETELLLLATVDKLTGAYNRHKWDEQFHIEINLARRGSVFSLILLDVDHFKQINDQYGHQVGDQILKHLAANFKKRLRSVDLLFRVGGEEFAILLPMQNVEAASQLAEQLRSLVELFSQVDLPPYTISFGVTEFCEADNEESMFKRADQALYLAKSSGRNQVKIG